MCADERTGLVSRPARRVLVLSFYSLLALWTVYLMAKTWTYQHIEDRGIPMVAGSVVLFLLAVDALRVVRGQRRFGTDDRSLLDRNLPEQGDAPGADRSVNADTDPTGAQVDAPADAVAEVPADATATVPADTVAEVPADATAEVPADAQTEVPADAQTEAPTTNQYVEGNISVIGWIALYPVFVYLVGFVTATGCFVFLFVLWYKRDLVLALKTTVVVSAGYYLLFVVILDVFLWDGVLGLV